MEYLFEFWARYMRRAKHENEEEKKEMLKELGFFEFIKSNNEEDFFNYLNRIMASFGAYSREKILTAYKQGIHIGRLNELSPTQKSMVKQEKRLIKYNEEGHESTEGPHSGDQEGFEESFIDIDKINAAEEFKQAYDEEEEKEE